MSQAQGQSKPSNKKNGAGKPAPAKTSGAIKAPVKPRGNPLAPASPSGAAKRVVVPPPALPVADKGDLLTDLWLRFGRYGRDALGVSLIAFALITLVGFALRYMQPDQPQGILITLWLSFIGRWVGWGWPLVVLAIFAAGLVCVIRPFGRWIRDHIGRLVALEVAAFALLALLTIWNGWSLDRAETGLDGGRIGWGLATLVGAALPLAWGTVALMALILLLVVYASGLLTWSLHRLETWLNAVNPAGMAAPAAAGPRPDSSDDDLPDVAPEGPRVRNPELPPLDLLLNDQSVRPEVSYIQETARQIESRLAEFGVPATVVGYRVGPTVTQYAVEPGYIDKTGPDGEPVRQKVRVAQISALARDLTLALSAERLRIEAPVPGRTYVGIEVPNQLNAVVRLRTLMEDDAFTRLSSPLAVALGRDVSGQPVVADLTRMPHLLIAGTTGSGKSICIEALATCLVTNNTPDDLRIAMLDPKMVELARFNGLPHLFGKVETEIERMLGVLKWALMEMDRRYHLLEEAHSRDVISYNRKMEKRGQPRLPRIVVFIDELADLMMTAPDQTEHSLIRLAQMARATGIHLVVATQRPSTDVVTGLIKANFPARLAFTVASSIDSRVILDTNGAETLLGKGDMLFLNPESGTPLRAQGALVSDEEIERITAFWKQKTPLSPSAEPEAAPWEDLVMKEGDEDSDQLVEQAVKIVRTTQRASTSLLQRRLRIGYPRAARLMDELEDLGVVGPSQGGGKERDVLLPPGDDEPQDHSDAES
ncbi:MAG TPA: DNA translocase FtsK [Anaerolineaceae bacterium]